MIIAFFGHKDYKTGQKVQNRLYNLICDVAQNNDVEFWLGGYGNFDREALHCCKRYKQQHNNAKLVFVTPYLDEKYLSNKIDKNVYDEIVLGADESPKRYSIAERNKFIVKNADIVFCFVERCFGGAFTSRNYALKLNKKVIDLV